MKSENGHQSEGVRVFFDGDVGSDTKMPVSAASELPKIRWDYLSNGKHKPRQLVGEPKNPTRVAEEIQTRNRDQMMALEAEWKRQCEPAKRVENGNWNHLILPQEIKDDLQTYCEVLRNHEHYSKQGISLPKGLLFHGPPGVGKTETARVLSRQAGFRFVSLSTADCKVGWIGHAAVKIQNTFAEARQNAPSMIFIDELDAVCPPRGAYHDCLSQEATAQLLQEMDGLNSSSQAIFVFGATNRVDMIDPAFLQRFTEHVEIGLPGPEQRMKLISLFIGKIPFTQLATTPEVADFIQDVLNANKYSHTTAQVQRLILDPQGKYDRDLTTRILARLALATEGKSGRDLRNLVTKATMRAIRRSSKDGVQRPVMLKEIDFCL